jgi:hypothetical protein
VSSCWAPPLYTSPSGHTCDYCIVLYVPVPLLIADISPAEREVGSYLAQVFLLWSRTTRVEMYDVKPHSVLFAFVFFFFKPTFFIILHVLSLHTVQVCPILFNELLNFNFYTYRPYFLSYFLLSLSLSLSIFCV